MITEQTIQEALRASFGNHKYVLCNSFVFMWESDFFSISKSGYCYEVEVKISRSDYFKDFEKEKHFMFKNSKGKQVLQSFPEAIKQPLWNLNGVGYANGSDILPDTRYDREYYEYCKMKWHDVEKFVIPNRFYYAVPAGLITEKELPAYCGLIEFEGHSTSISIEAPFLHKRNLFEGRDFYKTLLDKFYWLAENQRKSVEWNKYEADRLNTCVENLRKQLEEYNRA